MTRPLVGKIRVEQPFSEATAGVGGNPWGGFLKARARAIDLLHEEGNSDSEIAEVLSATPEQVRLIRTRDRKWDPQGVVEPQG